MRAIDVLPAANAAPLASPRTRAELLAIATAFAALAILCVSLAIGMCLLVRAIADGWLVAMGLLGFWGTRLAALSHRMWDRADRA